MDKSWMEKKRGSREYFEGVTQFMEFASRSARDGRILCPCAKCVNLILQPLNVARDHCWTSGMLNNYKVWKFHGESEASTMATECGSSHVQESQNVYGDFRGLLHDLCPSHEMAPGPMEEDPIAQHSAEGPNDKAKKFYKMIDEFYKMIDDVDQPLYEGCTKFSIFMHLRSGANLPCYTLTPPSSTETAQRMTSLENLHQSLRDQLAQSEQKHKEEIAELHAKHEEQIAEALSEAKRQSDAQHKEQMAEALAEAKRQSDAQHKKHMDEMMSSMRAMLDRLMPGVDFSGSLRCLDGAASQR